mmetsp:Transcript_99869/g.311898  ORF Transcript_99869/g.311898 Transcript_99869/m.311898 type:complete len:234 (-) Transcript_99869:4-705(-)
MGALAPGAARPVGLLAVQDLARGGLQGEAWLQEPALFRRPEARVVLEAPRDRPAGVLARVVQVSAEDDRVDDGHLREDAAWLPLVLPGLPEHLLAGPHAGMVVELRHEPRVRVPTIAVDVPAVDQLVHGRRKPDVAPPLGPPAVFHAPDPRAGGVRGIYGPHGPPDGSPGSEGRVAWLRGGGRGSAWSPAKDDRSDHGRLRWRCSSSAACANIRCQHPLCLRSRCAPGKNCQP